MNDFIPTAATAPLAAGVPAEPRRRLRQKRLGFLLLTVLLTLVVCEGLARLGMLALEGDKWRHRQLTRGVNADVGTDTGETLHPYFGVAYDPFVNPGIDYDGRRIPIDPLGLASPRPIVQHRSDDRLLVGILGGSFAWQFSVLGAERLEQVLQQDPRLAGRRIEVVSLAASTFKQPQQVMILNYVLTLGGEFDVLINIDGFNELALARETDEARVYYAYPRMWPYRTMHSRDPRIEPELHRVRQIREERQQLTAAIRTSWLRGLALANLWWMYREYRGSRELADLGNRLHEHNLKYGIGFERGGPHTEWLPDDVLFPQYAALWERSSVQLQAAAEKLGLVYLHALQPNQYVPGSKPLSPEEQSGAFDETCGYCKSVRTGYSLLQGRAESLRRQGVDFIDLTSMFADVPETLYVDECCHLNAAGYERVAERLGRELLQRLPD